MSSQAMNTVKSLRCDAKVIVAGSEVIARLFLDEPPARADRKLVVYGDLRTDPCKVQTGKGSPIVELHSAETFLHNLSALHNSQRAMLVALKKDHEASRQEDIAEQSLALSVGSEELEDVASAVAGCVQDQNSRALIFRQSIVELRKVTLEAAFVSLRANGYGTSADEAAALAAKTLLRGSHHHSKSALSDNLARLHDTQSIFRSVFNDVDPNETAQVAMKVVQAVEQRAIELRQRPRSAGVNPEFLGYVRTWLNGYTEIE
jgi:hypothetical protein